MFEVFAQTDSLHQQQQVFERSPDVNFFDVSSTATCSPGLYYLFFFGFVFALVLFYTLTTRFMEVSEAALFNLNLLTMIMYVCLFEWIRGELEIGFSYFVSVVFVVVGVCLYKKAGNPADNDNKDGGGDSDGNNDIDA